MLQRTSPSPFWAPDDPVKRPDAAFGQLTPTPTVITAKDGKPQTFAIKHFVLDAALPTIPDNIAVYLSGVYPATHTNAKISGAGWSYVPDLALVFYLGKPLTPPSGDTLAEKAAAVLKQYDLLMKDSEQATAVPLDDGGTGIAFFRHVSGIPVYGNKPACVTFTSDGQVSSLQIRRRPLLEVSLYPTLPPEQAWEKLQRQEYTKPANHGCQDGGTALVGEVAEFRVKAVELAYWEPHVDTPRQIIMPYYVFRDEEGHTLYVPAVASEMLTEESHPS